MSNTEQNLNAMRDFKWTLKNLNLSDEAKGSDKVQLDQDIDHDKSGKDLYKSRDDQNKDSSKVPAGPKAARSRHGEIDLDKEKAYEELIRMGGETPEE